MLVASVFVGCAGSDLSEKTSVNPGEVSIALKSSHVGIEVDTRAPYEGEMSATNPLIARVLTTQTPGKDYDAAYANGVMVFEKQSSVTMYNPNYPLEGESRFPENADPTDEFYFYGLYPHDKWSIGNSAIDASIPGNVDLMLAKELSATPQMVADGKVPPLAFQHLLTKLSIKLISGTDFASVYWGEIQGIKLTKVGGLAPASSATVDPVRGAFTPGTGGSAPKIYNIDADNVYTNDEYVAHTLPSSKGSVNAKGAGYSMVAPFESGTSDDLTFEITTQHQGTKTVGVELTKAKNTAGLAFEVTFTFNGGDDLILSSATVAPWKDGGGGNADLGDDK